VPTDSAFNIPHSPVAALGTVALMAAFLVAAYAAAAGIVGQRKRRPGLVASSVYASWAFTALMCFASCLIIYAFLSHDFRIKYVAHYSDSSMPLFYKLTAYWGGLDGSLMFWVWVLSMFSAVALRVNVRRHHDMIGYVVATISIVSLFFLALLLYSKNPFATFISMPPTEGRGLNPLLQNYWMVIHPPSLYVGYVGMTIPFAFGMGALASGRLDDTWIHSMRVWVIIPWFFLTLGLTLGGLWAYEELGWGGYWAWDPVENAGLIPWFTATAFLHSVIIQERRGMLKVWNLVLVITTFFLTIFGTFMTRSGIVQSVHAFGQDNQLALLFILFMTAVLVVSFGLLLHRLPALRSAATFESFWSREVAFLLNNWILLLCAFFVLFLTMLPTLREYLTGARITIGPPIYDRIMPLAGFLLLLLMAISPLLAWRRTTQRRLLQQLLIPVCSALGVMLLFWLFVPRTRISTAFLIRKLELPMSLLTFGLVAFSVATIIQEFIRGALVRARQTKGDFITSLFAITIAKRRKYGGLIVHLGIAVMFIGFAGKVYTQEKMVTLQHSGEKFQLGGYEFTYEKLDYATNPNRDMFTAHIAVARQNKPGKIITRMYPARWLYKVGQKEATTEVAIDRSLDKDLYLVLNTFEPQSQQANFTVFINPLVNLVWIGFVIFMIGTAICLVPLARLLRGGSASGLVILLAAGGLLIARPAFAQHIEETTPQEQNYSKLEERLHKDLVCLCGDCNRLTLHQCNCQVATKERATIAGMLTAADTASVDAEERAYERVVQAFIDRHGGEHVLIRPRDRGLNLLTYIVPSIALAGALALVIVVATRWVNRGRTAQAQAMAAAPAPTPTDPKKLTAYEEKLDDELADLD
jgi:cytochrome c-type biogenesis protein CcmF